MMLTTMTQTWRHRSTGWNTISGFGPRVQLSLLFSSSGLPPLHHPQRSCCNQRAGLGFAFARPLHSYVLGASLAALNAPASSWVQALGQQEVIGILKPLIPHVSFCVQHKRECPARVTAGHTQIQTFAGEQNLQSRQGRAVCLASSAVGRL